MFHNFQAVKSTTASFTATNSGCSSTSPTSRLAICWRPRNCHSADKPSRKTSKCTTPYSSTTLSDPEFATKPNPFSFSSIRSTFAPPDPVIWNWTSSQPSIDGYENRRRITACSYTSPRERKTNQPNIDTFDCAAVPTSRRRNGRNTSRSCSPTRTISATRSDRSKMRSPVERHAPHHEEEWKTKPFANCAKGSHSTWTSRMSAGQTGSLHRLATRRTTATVNAIIRMPIIWIRPIMRSCRR